MLEREEPLFAPLYELGLVLDGYDVAVRYSPDRMREDFLYQASLRSIDMQAAVELAQAFDVEVNEDVVSDGDNRFIIASADIVLAAPLRNSRFDLVVSRPLVEGYLYFQTTKVRRQLQSPGSYTPELVEQISQNVLNGFWRHEREHFLQKANLAPDDFDEVSGYYEQKDLINSRIRRVSAVATGAAVFVGGKIVVGYYDVGDLIFAAGASLLSAKTVSVALEKRLQYRAYKNSPLEIPAWNIQKGGSNLSGVFEVVATPNNEGTEW